MDRISLLLYNRISNTFYRKLSQIEANSRIKCEIKFKKAELNLGKNCNVRIINKCVANADIAFRLLIESIKEDLPNMTKQERKIIKEELGIEEDVYFEDDIPFQNEGELTIYTKCKAFAEVDNSIYIKNLLIEYCESEIPLYFEFINSGSAMANCGLNEFSRVLFERFRNTDGKNEENENKIVKFLNITIYDIFFKILIFLLILFIIYLLGIMIISVFKRFNIIYYSKNDIIPKKMIKYAVGLVKKRKNNLVYYNNV